MNLMMLMVSPNATLTDRRWQRTLAANPVSKLPGASEAEAPGGGSVHVIELCNADGSMAPHD